LSSLNLSFFDDLKGLNNNKPLVHLSRGLFFLYIYGMDKYKLEIRETNGRVYNVYVRIDDPKIMIYIDPYSEIIKDEAKLLAYLDSHFHQEKVNQYNKANSKGCNC